MNKNVALTLLAVCAIALGTGLLLYNIAGHSLMKQSDHCQKMQTEPFSRIEVDVKSADIIVKQGDTYSIEYSLPSREHVQKCVVENDTLTLDTKIAPLWTPSHESWYVVITVPKHADLSELMLETSAGTIEITGARIHQAELEGSASTIAMRNTTCDTLSAETVAGNIMLDNVKIHDASCKTISGDIYAHTNEASVTASTVAGTIHYNNEQVGRNFTYNAGNEELEVSCVSGTITLESL